MRGVNFCRGCNSTSLREVLDLGLSPIANNLSPTNQRIEQPTYPLVLMTCRECHLGQVGEYESPDQIFSNYPYLSGVSTTWVKHCEEYAQELSEILPNLNSVLEIASNDGTLLKQFLGRGAKVLGVEPARNVADIAIRADVPTEVNFFGQAVAQNLVVRKGYFDLVIANNVAAHVPDIQDFFAGLSTVCGPDTVIAIENPTLGFLYSKLLFDTIYHEHFSYLSVLSVDRLAADVGLQLFRVDTLETHGGSFRYYLRRHKDSAPEKSVGNCLMDEDSRGVGSELSEKSFRDSVEKNLVILKDWVESHDEKSIIGYGAAAKTVTLFSAARLNHAKFKFVVDNNPLKQGNDLPGTLIPIVDSSYIGENLRADVLIFPWNIADEIQESLKQNQGLSVWRSIPLEKMK
jgi:SAM-dependent methyltransferase